MGLRFTFADLYKAPEINPVNRKARAVPILNPVNQYGRVFFFSWFGFMIAFWAWYSTSHPTPLCKSFCNFPPALDTVYWLLISIVSGKVHADTHLHSFSTIGKSHGHAVYTVLSCYTNIM